jgi:RHS repeat-associated protein
VTKAKGNPRTRTSYALSDALGSVRQVLSERGKTMNTYSYTPFGEAFNVREAVAQPFRYTGRRWDENVGKLWYRSRHYDAGRGRFSQADKWNGSVLNPIGNHAFGYVNGNPVRWVDPMGQFEVTQDLLTACPNINELINELQVILKTTFPKVISKSWIPYKDEIVKKGIEYSESFDKQITLSLFTKKVMMYEKLPSNTIGFTSEDESQIYISSGSDWFVESLLLHEIVHAYWIIEPRTEYMRQSTKAEIIPIPDETNRVNSFQEVTAEYFEDYFKVAYQMYKHCAE